MEEERKLLDDRMKQLALKCPEQQKEIMEWEESKETEKKEMRERYDEELLEKDSTIRKLKQGSQVFENDISQIEKDYEKKIAELKRKVEESETKKKALERDEGYEGNGNSFKSDSRTDTLNKVNFNLNSQLANVEQLNKELTEQLKNETIINDANKFDASERKLTEEIEYLKELRKSMETTIQVLMADNNIDWLRGKMDMKSV
ncbi:hypothetical protein HHI36_000815 [Cryptolaemus montrouzieri]|uniref:Uncharacterized protein n=1 Tax=Cryptolaemus montrouzieri TaxID=559131 RepID=A0ABD2P5Y2_9CUCU